MHTFIMNLSKLTYDNMVIGKLTHRYFSKFFSGANYEPPLTNVFTMQWFLTLFATCLPKETALRVCDSVFLEGSEILLRTAVAIWGKLQE